MHVDSKTDRLAPSQHVKSGHSRPARKTPWEKCFAGGPIVAQNLVLAESKLALYDTCSSGIHVVKEPRACACHLPKGNTKIRWYVYCCAGWSDSKCRIVGCGHIQIVGNYVPLFTLNIHPHYRYIFYLKKRCNLFSAINRHYNVGFWLSNYNAPCCLCR